MSLLFYQAIVYFRSYNETVNNRIKQNKNKYCIVVNKLNKQYKIKKLKGFATSVMNRYWFVLGGDFHAVGIFPGQRHYQRGIITNFNDTQYRSMINNTINKLPKNQFLIVELSDDFIKGNKQFILQSNYLFNEENIFVFRR